MRSARASTADAVSTSSEEHEANVAVEAHALRAHLHHGAHGGDLERQDLVQERNVTRLRAEEGGELDGSAAADSSGACRRQKAPRVTLP